MQKSLVYLAFLFFLLMSCTKDKAQMVTFTEEVKAILLDCRAHPLEDVDSIGQQLIGNWTLIGYDCSFCTPHANPVASITFTENGGQFQYKTELEEVNFNFDWQLKDNRDSGGEIMLTTDPKHYGLTMSNFCKGYMSHDRRALDGTLHIYEKQ